MPGTYAVILGGDACTADGDYAASCGYSCRAAGNYSAAVGNDTEASGVGAFASGSSTIARGNYSSAIGAGCDTEEAATASFAAGSSNTCKSPYCVAFGHYNRVGNQSPLGTELAGQYGFASGTNNVVLGQNAVAMGQSNAARARHSFTQGEDSESLSARAANYYHDGSPASTGGESSACLNHFHTAGGRASTLVGGNCWSTFSGQHSFLQGFGAKGTRDTQRAQAGGGFTPHSQQEDMFKTYAAGDAQTSCLVFRGDTSGSAAGQQANGVGLKYGPNGAWLFDLEPNRAYAMKTTTVVDGWIIVDEAETDRATCMFKHEGLVSVASNGAVSILLQSHATTPSPTSSTNPTFGTANTAAWTFKFEECNSPGHGITLLMKVDDETFAKTHTSCKVEFTEVVLPGTREDVAGAGFDQETLEIIDPT